MFDDDDDDEIYWIQRFNFNHLVAISKHKEFIIEKKFNHILPAKKKFVPFCLKIKNQKREFDVSMDIWLI